MLAERGVAHAFGVGFKVVGCRAKLGQCVGVGANEGEPRLFEWLGRSVQLTECGRALLPKAQEILRLLADVRSAVETLRSGIAGNIRLGCIPTITP